MHKASLAGQSLDDVPLTSLACGDEFACIAEANGITIDVGDDVNDDMNDDAQDATGQQKTRWCNNRVQRSAERPE